MGDNAGQTALSVVGFAIGAYFGNPSLGLYLGGLAGSAFFPTKLPGVSGPRLTDTRTTQVEIGVPLMEVFGTDVVPGTVLWLAPVRTVETKEEQGGKGGGSTQTVTTYTYFQPIAIGLCRADAPKGGIRRIWENGALVYDARPQQEGESASAYAARANMTNIYAQGFMLHLGGQNQDPDPTIESFEGVGNAPGFSGLMYIVYIDRQLLDSQGQRHPNFKFEIASGVLMNLTTTGRGCRVEMEWDSVTGTDTYDVYRTDEEGSTVLVYSGLDLEFTDEDVLVGELYRYQVFAIQGALAAAASNQSEVAATPCEIIVSAAIPSAPFDGHPYDKRRGFEKDPVNGIIYGAISLEHYVPSDDGGATDLGILGAYTTTETGAQGSFILLMTTAFDATGVQPSKQFTVSWQGPDGITRTFDSNSATKPGQSNGYGGAATLYRWQIPLTSGSPTVGARWVDGGSYTLTFSPANLPP